VPGVLALLRRRYADRVNAGPALCAWAEGQALGAASALSALYTPGELATLLGPNAPEQHALAPPDVPRAEGPGFLDAVFAWDTGRYLPDDLLVKVDVASMAYGLENRSPLLDHRLFEHVARLSASRRTHPRATKPLLRRHARGRLDPAVLAAPKRGFPLPLDDWLRGPLGAWLDRQLDPLQAMAGPLRRDAVAAELAAFRAGRGPDVAPLRLWSLAALEFWARHFGVETGG
jgi:asparagine synthase (glutamine-hydrolysing)